MDIIGSNKQNHKEMISAIHLEMEKLRAKTIRDVKKNGFPRLTDKRFWLKASIARDFGIKRKAKQLT